MLRRLPVLLVVLLVAALLAPAALAVRVKVRVEGKTTTIFGTSQPQLETGDTALNALDTASVVGEFYFHVLETSFGPFVDQIGRYPGEQSTGWVFKVNGVSPPVGADKVILNAGDTVLWYYATFSDVGGPETLELKGLAKGCYQVISRNDAGNTSAAAGAVLRVDGRSFPTRAGRACLKKHKGLVRATRPGSVRSNSVA